MRYESYTRVEPVPADDLSGRPFMGTRVPYRYDVDAASRANALLTPEPTRTQQQFKDEVDINTIAKNFGMTGKLPQNVRMPSFGDFTGVEDYQTAVNAAKWAEHSFMQMPALVRERFRNDPQQFLQFCDDDRNRDEAIKLGLIISPPIDPNVPAPKEPPKPV